MIGSIAAALGLDSTSRAAGAVQRAREGLATSVREREQLAADTALAADDFERTGSDASAGKLAKLRLRAERAERLETDARNKLAAAESEAAIVKAEVHGAATLAALVVAEEQDAAAAADLARLSDVAMAALEKLGAAIARTSSISTAHVAARAAARAAIADLRAVAPDRAVPMETTLRERTIAAASRQLARARALPLARVAAQIGKVGAIAADRVRALVTEQGIAASFCSRKPMVPGCADVILESEAQGPSPAAEWVSRWLALGTGQIPPLAAVPPAPRMVSGPTWPGSLRHGLDDGERIDARRLAVEVLLYHDQGITGDDARAELDRRLAIGAPEREARNAERLRVNVAISDAAGPIVDVSGMRHVRRPRYAPPPDTSGGAYPELHQPPQDAA